MDTNSSKQLFGSAIARWFRQNDWPQKICERWSECDGRGVKGPWASQISQVVHGRLDPRTIFFDALGEFNHSIAEQDLTRVQQADRELYSRLSRGRPFLLDSGSPATATDFFSMFVGEMLIPDYYQGGDFTDADFLRILTTCNQTIERVSLECYMSKSEILAHLDETVFLKHGVLGGILKRLALELEKPSAETMVRLCQSGEMEPTKGCPVMDELVELMAAKCANEEPLMECKANQETVNGILLQLAAAAA